MTSADVARAADVAPPPSSAQTQVKEKSQSLQFPSSTASAPSLTGSSEFQLPEGNQWRYSELIGAVQAGKVERVRFSKDGSQLQVGFDVLDGPVHRWAGLLCVQALKMLVQ